jgi:hypothetical protein
MRNVQCVHRNIEGNRWTLAIAAEVQAEERSNRHFDMSDRARAAGQDVPRFDIVIRDSAVVHHVDLARDFPDLACAANAEVAAGGDI